MAKLSIERQDKAFAMRAKGLSFADIALELGVSRSRAHNIFLEAKRRLSVSSEWYAGLSTRARNALQNVGIDTLEDLALYLRDNPPKHMLSGPNLGKASFAEFLTVYTRLVRDGRLAAFPAWETAAGRGVTRAPMAPRLTTLAYFGDEFGAAA